MREMPSARLVCLVPESREEITTEGGLDVIGQNSRVGEVVASMKEVGIATSLFIDPDSAQIEKSAELGSPWTNCILALMLMPFTTRLAKMSWIHSGKLQSMHIALALS